MIRNKFIAAILLLTSMTTLSAANLQSAAESSQKATSTSSPTLKWYGFIRNYFAYDSRECKSGTADLFIYLPLDENIVNDIDQNAVPSFTYSAITSRLGLDVSGYEIADWKIGAKIEADFYAGLTGVTGTATFRLRQAYMTMSKNAASYKIGQSWHPMAADFPDVFSLNTGAPFGPFIRTPLVQADFKLEEKMSFTAAAIWQMQYTSAGPDGAKADYMKYGILPELYLGLNYKSQGLSLKLGANMLSIKPRKFTKSNTLANDRITTFGAFAYLSYTKNLFSLRAKTYLGEGGEHMNLNCGYAVADRGFEELESWNYTPYRNTSSWISFKYGKDLQLILFAGYYKNLGTSEKIHSTDSTDIFYSKNSYPNLNRLYRITPSVIYNMGKVAIGFEYACTSAQYGSWNGDNRDDFGLATKNLHWVTNNRIQVMVKYTF